MSLFSNAVSDTPIAIPPEVTTAPPDEPAPDAYEVKRRKALRYLGEKWCIAATRKAQLEDIRNSVEDLV